MAGQDDKKINGESNASDNSINPTNSEQTSEMNITEEYDFLDTKLDELNSALDFLEQKNDNIHERLKELLQSNRDIREQLRNESPEVEADK